MKIPKPAVDKTAAVMNAKAGPSKSDAKGVSFNSSVTNPAPNVGLGMQQHNRTMNKHGNRHNAPHEHMEPTEAIFNKIGR